MLRYVAGVEIDGIGTDINAFDTRNGSRSGVYVACELFANFVGELSLARTKSMEWPDEGS
jgi:hypothetical protein